MRTLVLLHSHGRGIGSGAGLINREFRRVDDARLRAHAWAAGVEKRVSRVRPGLIRRCPRLLKPRDLARKQSAAEPFSDGP